MAEPTLREVLVRVEALQIEVVRLRRGRRGRQTRRVLPLLAVGL